MNREYAMPVYSMTGYASAQHSTGTATPEGEAKVPAGQLGLEIRSVNSRFLDLSFRLPEDLRQFEPALRDLLVGSLKRGKVEVRASIEMQAASSIAEPTPRMLQRLNAVQDNVKAWLPAATPLSVGVTANVVTPAALSPLLPESLLLPPPPPQALRTKPKARLDSTITPVLRPGNAGEMSEVGRMDSRLGRAAIPFILGLKLRRPAPKKHALSARYSAP